MRTRDGRYRVYLHHDHTAELSDQTGKIILSRTQMYRISQYLAELGIKGDDLIED